ncbi:MAG: L,D-transpeptidase family protein [Alphaproteobacteria bacterium]
MKRVTFVVASALAGLLAAEAAHALAPQLGAPWTRYIATMRIDLDKRMAELGAEKGDRVFIRLFKASNELELWMETSKGYKLAKTYPICSFSGNLGPKLREGDKQAPEGFYSVTRGRLQPNSQYHLAFNLGFPNAYDRSHGRTGSFLMIHGSCGSSGCYAMTDERIAEIYGVVEAAIEAGQEEVPVHVFPFRMTEKNMRWYRDSKWAGFWQNLAKGYRWFEEHGRPPEVEVHAGQYMFADPANQNGENVQIAQSQ